MSVLDRAESDLAYEVLTGVQRVMKGPGRRCWTSLYYRLDKDSGAYIDTHKISVGGDKYWSPAWMYYDPTGPALVICATFGGKENELIRIDLNDPKSLTRASLRAYFKKAVEYYAEGCRKAALGRI